MLNHEKEFVRTVLDNIADGVVACDAAGNLQLFNRTSREWHGMDAMKMAPEEWGRHYDLYEADGVTPLATESIPLVRAFHGETLHNVEMAIAARGQPVRYLAVNGGPFFDEHHKQLGAVVVLCDVTERKQSETYREMGREVLQILNESGDLQDSILRVIATLKQRTGFDAVGIRLQEGEDFPYSAQQGFPGDLLLTENTLTERSAEGGICRGKDGNVNLECTCGLVISGKIDPTHPLFTPGGSFWTNNSFPLLKLPNDQDPRRHPRNQCIHHGYASVALVPIRNKDKIVGLIQFNDRRKGCFTRQVIEYLEGIASHIGEALLRKQTEETIKFSLREKESLLKEIHHRVKNNLQVISSLLNLQSHQLDSPITKAALKDTQNRVRSMALIHEHLYRSENLAAVDMAAYLRQLCAQLFRTLLSSQGTIKLHIDVAEFHLVIDQAIPCGLLVNELVSNSLKHAFPGGRTGEIRVELQPVDNGFLSLKIRDNGIGLPPGFELKNLTSLGLNLVSDLSRQMGGTLGIGPGPGAVFEVTFKAKKY